MLKRGRNSKTKSIFPGAEVLKKSVFDFVRTHYTHTTDSDMDHGDYKVNGQSGRYTHYHVYEPDLGHGKHVILRLNTVILANVTDQAAALNFVNSANQELSHAACLSHLVFGGEGSFIMSASQTVLLEYDHDLYHDIFSNHIVNNHWYLSMAQEGELPSGFEVVVNYEFGSSSGN